MMVLQHKLRTRVAVAAATTVVAASSLVLVGFGPVAATPQQEAPATPSAFGPTTTFGYTGATQTIAVPTRALRVRIDAVGGQGGALPGFALLAGSGDKVRGLVDVVPGTSTLYVNVGGNGGNGAAQPGIGGWNGGGTGGTGVVGLSGTGGGGGGGGGSSDVRTGPSDAERIFVAAGGGGAGGTPSTATPGSRGGDAGQIGVTPGSGGGGGGAGLATSGGAGGLRPAGQPTSVTSGTSGGVYSGGAGGQSTTGAGGGGGGGGRYAGGGGGGGPLGGGGGGGFSFSAGSIEKFFSADRSPRVLISFDLAPPDFVDCSGVVRGVVGDTIDKVARCWTKGLPIPTLTIDGRQLPPGIRVGQAFGSDGTGYVLYGTYTKAGHYSVPVTATRAGDDETQLASIEFEVSAAPLGTGAPTPTDPTTTTASTATAAAAGASASTPARPRFTG